MAFTKLNWIDEIKDEEGNVIQEGTLLSAANLNRFENGFEENANEVDKRFDDKVIEVDAAFEVQKSEVLKLIENKWDNEDVILNTNDFGYMKLPNGIIIQWGRNTFRSAYFGSDTSSYGHKTQFPVTFPNKCLSITSNPIKSAYFSYDFGYRLLTSSVDEITNTQFEGHVGAIEGGVGEYTSLRRYDNPCFWIAIGF